jgi:hypothetical protein
MKKWGRRIRAAIGMGLTWGAAWFGAGILLARVPGLDSDLPFALLFAPLGFVTGIIFSGILVGIEGRRGLGRTSLSRFAGWGAASGLLLSGVFVVGAALRGGAWWGEFLVFGPPLAMASAVCAAGSLAVARRAERRELPGDSGHPAEAELTGKKIGNCSDAVTDMSAWLQPAASKDVAHPDVEGGGRCA